MAKPITDLVALGIEIHKEVAEKFGNNVKLAMAYCHATDEKNLTEAGVMVSIVDYNTDNEKKYCDWMDDVTIAVGGIDSEGQFIAVECFISVQEWFERHEQMMMENYCEECDNVVHSIVNVHDFYSFKVGRIKCDTCGHSISPCNECWNEKTNSHHNCADCPYKNSKVLEPMSDEDYIKWHMENEPATFECMLNGDFGDLYQDIAKKLID